MRERLHGSVVPAYLLLCLLLGGSVQGVWRVTILQLLAVALIAWAAVTPKKEPATGASRSLLLLIVLTLLLFVAQLVPLPPDIWTGLPGREAISSGYRMLGQDLPWLPLSMTPYETLGTFPTLLPPIAVVVGVVRLGAYRESWIAGAILTGTLLAVLLGAVQSLGGFRPDAWWFLYDLTNSGAVGFFANRNHMGTLLLVSIPFAVALIASGSAEMRRRDKSHGLLAIGIGGLLVVLAGIALNRSSAVMAMALPVLGFSALLLPVDWRSRRLIFAGAALLMLVAVILYLSGPLPDELAGTDTTSFDTRRWFWALTWSSVVDSFPFGTGVGSFRQIFAAYEDPAGIEATYVNHAHNDYLELMLETGVAGLLLLAAFLLWWGAQVVRAWSAPLGANFARAATIASGAILAHSVVDYPLRTAALSAVFAACLAIMAQPRQRGRRDRASELRPSRHLTIG